MASTEVSVIVSAVDRLTAPITKMNAAMARLAAPARAVNAAMGNLSNVSGVGALGDRLQRVGGAVRDVSGHVGDLAGKLAGLAGIGTLGLGAGAVAMGKSVVSVSAQFEKFETILTTIMGSNAKAKESMKWVADFAAKTPYELDGVMDSFVKLKSYGIDPTDGSLQTLGDAAAAMGKPLNQAVEALADGITGEMERMKEFGVKSSTKGDIVSMAFTDAKGRQRTFEAAKDDAKAMQSALLAIFKAKGFDGAMDNLSKTWDGMSSNLMDNISGFWRSIGDAGSFAALKGKLADLLAWIDKLKSDGTLDAWAKRISDAFVTALTAIETKVKAVDWEAVWIRVNAAIADFVGWVQQAVQFVGGWENAALVVVAVMNGSLIASVVNLTLALGGAALGFVRVGFSMAAMAFGPVIAAVGNFITALRAGYGVVAAFNLVLAANPIGVVIMALAALGGAVYALYANWDTVGPYFSAAWDMIKSVFSAAIDGILSVLSVVFTPHLIVAKAINDMIASITGVDLFAVGSDWIGRFWDGLKEKWTGLTTWLSGAMGTLTDWMPDWAKDQLGLSAPKGKLDGGAPPPSAVKTVAGAPASVPAVTPASVKPPVLPQTAAAAVKTVAAAPASVPAVTPASVKPPVPPQTAAAVQAAATPGAVPPPVPGVKPTPGAVPSVPGAKPTPPAPAAPSPVASAPAGPPPTVSVPAAPAPTPAPAGAAAIVPPPLPGAKPAPPSTSTTTISAPVTVSITVNGVAELDLFKREAQAVVDRALAEWRSSMQSDAAASLHDH